MRLIESEMAVRELAKIEKNILIPYLLKLIPQEKNVDKQISMIGSLVGSGSEDYKRDIFSVVKPIYDKSDLLPVKSAVLMLMGDLNIQESFDLLVDTIKENETIYYAYIAIISIGDHGNVKAIPVLELRANSANPNIREAAEYSLEKITNPNFIPEEVVAPKTLLDKKKNLDRNQLLLKKIDSKIKDVS